MDRNFIIGLLIVVVIVAGGFSFVQTQNLTSLQATSTEVVSDLRDSGTQSAEEAIATGTSLAISSFATATQAADNAQQAAEMSTQSAANAIATITQSVDNARATGTQLAGEAYATASEAAVLAASQAVSGTDTANLLATQQIENTVVAIVFADSQATSDAQLVAMQSTLAASRLIGGGVRGNSADIPTGFSLFEGEGYEILLTDNFVAGDFVSDTVSDLEKELSLLGLDDTFDLLTNQNDNLFFFAIDTTLIRNMPRASISLIGEAALTEETTLSDYISRALFSLQGDFALIASDILPMNGQPTGRIIIDQQFSNTAVRQVQYIFMVERHFYILTITTPILEYANLRDVLETSALSLRIHD